MARTKKLSTNIQTIQLFWKFTKKNTFLFWYGTIGAIGGVLTTDIIPPLIIAMGFNKIQSILSHNQPLVLSALLPYLLWYTFFTLASTVIWRTQAYCVWKYDILAQQRIMEYLFNHLQSMGSKFHADRFGGALVSQVNKFVSAYDRTVGDFTWNIVTGVSALLASLTILFLKSPYYASVFTLVMLAYFWIVYKRMQVQMPFNRKLSTSESERTAKLADSVTNIATFRAFAGERHETKLFHRQAGDTTRHYTNLMSVQLKNELLSQVGTSLIEVLAFAGGLVAITVFKAPVGSLYLVVTYTLSLTNRLWQSMFTIRNINRSFGDAADMTDILQLEPEIKDIDEPQPFVMQKGAITFSHVAFGYQEDAPRLVFKDLDFTINAGQKIGLVGHSGGGKTTVTKLLLRFADIQSGTISIDNQNIASVRQAELRSHIAFVPQEPLLFHRSITENISYAKPEASMEEVIRVAKLAHADEFIKDLPHGYDTLVGERGVKLSGGQRQRIAIARAMLKDAPILVLDEATSALDSESEVLIQDALWKLMEGRTAIVIAHRLSTIQKMDRIIVLEHGAISEQGTHKELIKHKGTYAGLWAHQSGGFLED